RFEPEHLRDWRACLAVALESIRAAARTVERKHYEAAQALTERVGGDDLFQLGDGIPASAQRKLSLDTVLDRLSAELSERRDGSLGERLVGEVGERWTAPHAERIGQELGSLLGPGAARTVEEAFEPIGVDRFRGDREAISSSSGLQDCRGSGLRPAGFQ